MYFSVPCTSCNRCGGRISTRKLAISVTESRPPILLCNLGETTIYFVIILLHAWKSIQIPLVGDHRSDNYVMYRELSYSLDSRLSSHRMFANQSELHNYNMHNIIIIVSPVAFVVHFRT